ncbi:uncharacterized protein EV154DRAFT_476337 [Mucor mucedo]|uniref:uncharacterized protein n=1 Tax=Mucor mucedo TaxID=29922 RepID=UPI00221E6D7E|nr:uncharacterized protein EV154DRAFT_476337 [Mucor mucedo]KAI7896694.1 hypothetical protein EV154DRAFT_476337 [Mucor mucedo]
MNKNKGFQEVSIYFGMIELLVIGGFEFDDKTEILVPTTQQSYMNTERLLNQYGDPMLRGADGDQVRLFGAANFVLLKNCSYKHWGYHSLHAYLNKFIPIIPIDFHNHVSQKHKAYNIYHFASALLNILCSKRAVTKAMMEELWGSFTRINTYEQLMKAIIKDQEKSQVYLKMLIKIASKLETRSPNYSSAIFGLSSGREKALSIMVDGLKDHIKRQNAARKRELRL